MEALHIPEKKKESQAGHNVINYLKRAISVIQDT